MDRYLFLDVDGVLNSDSTKERAPGGYVFVEDILVERVSRIVKATGAKVILSSDWRITPGNSTPNDFACHDALINKLAEFNIHIFDETGEVLWNRGREIKDWFEKQHINWENVKFVIIDDMPPQEFEELGDYLIQTSTDYWSGIQEEDVECAIIMLS